MTWVAGAPAAAPGGLPLGARLRSAGRDDNPLLPLQAHLHHQHRRVNAGWTADTGMLGESCTHPRLHNPAVNRPGGVVPPGG